MRKRILSALLAFIVVFPTGAFTAAPVFAVDEDINNMNAFDALGIDTEIMPEGYDPYTTDNPYGKDNVAVKTVYELFTREDKPVAYQYEYVPLITPPAIVMGTGRKHTTENKLYGHGQVLLRPLGEFFGSVTTKTNELPALPEVLGMTPNEWREYLPFAATASAEGNFDGSGKKSSVVTVGIAKEPITSLIMPAASWGFANSLTGGLFLYFTDPVSGAVSSRLELMAPGQTIGNGEGNLDDLPYLMQNYLKITAGDFDGDGIDEVAVYIPEKGGTRGGSRVEVYKLQKAVSDTDDVYLDTAKWQLAWTHPLREVTYVSNMVSLLSGDFTRDGVDDLAVTWGYFFGNDLNRNESSQAWVLFGHKNNMLQKGVQLPLEARDDSGALTTVARAAFAYGDVNGDNVDNLVMGGQLASDVSRRDLNTRYVGIYDFDGEGFRLIDSKNVDVLEKDDNGSLIHKNVSTFFSSPGCVANVCTIRPEGMEDDLCIYLDSILIAYGREGLSIKTVMDENRMSMIGGGQLTPYYVEYGAKAADFTGSGKETLNVMQYILPEDNSFDDPFKWYMWYYFWLSLLYTSPYQGNHYHRTMGDVARVDMVDSSFSFCTPDTDLDSAVLEYTGEHYVMYSDPKVLAVLASPPYFSDLDNDELGGNYMGSSTSYSSSKGTGTGTSHTDTFNLGGFISIETEFSIFGIGAKFQTELAYTHGWTWETSKTSTLEQTITYSTLAGQDTVVLYSIPMEVYVYQSTVPLIGDDGLPVLDGSGNMTYDTQKMAVNLPHDACIVTMALDAYEDIAKDYPVLPQVSGTIFKHTIGEPWTYPAGSGGYKEPIVYDGDWSRVGFGLGSQTQELAMTEENTKGMTHTNTVDFKIGAGPKFGNTSIVVGVILGYEGTSGKVTINTVGKSFSGEICDMPRAAEEYGYGMSWKIFSYTFNKGASMEFPVVNYLVHDVTAPPILPPDFKQNIELTTDSQIALEWSYKGAAAGFQLYRYYSFPDGTGSYELAFVRASDVLYAEDGIRYYRFIDENLNPYSEYFYQIQTIGTVQPNTSIKSPVLSAMTKSERGYPQLRIDIDPPVPDPDYPLDMLVYPDGRYTITAVVENPWDYKDGNNINYQWQKLVDGAWTDAERSTAKNPDVLVFQNAGTGDKGEYRCRVNVIYYDSVAAQEYYISAYSESVTVDYSKRSAEMSLAVSDKAGSIQSPMIIATVASTHPGHNVVPAGLVYFEIIGADLVKHYVAGRLDTEGKATVSLDYDLPAGVYEITADYEGNRVFKAVSAKAYYLSGASDGYALSLNEQYVYGDGINPMVKNISKDNGVVVETPYAGAVDYKVTSLDMGADFTGAFVIGGEVFAAKAGTYVMEAYEGNNQLAYRNFAVLQKPLTLYAAEDRKAAGQGITHPLAAEYLQDLDNELAFGDQVANLGLAIMARDTAGREVTLSESTPPGAYTIVGIPDPNLSNPNEPNYSYTFVSAIYILTGTTYKLEGVAKQLEGLNVGYIELLVPEGNDNTGWTTGYPSGSQLLFLATPNPGYEVKGWEILWKGSGGASDQTETRPASSTTGFQMSANDTTVTVEFRVKQSTLSYQANPPEGGAVTCVGEDVKLENGAIVMTGAEYVFKAIPKDGYHFTGWEIHELNRSPVFITNLQSAYDSEDGLAVYNFKMGNASTRLYANFERDSYVITLDGNIEAVYYYDDDDDVTTPDVEMVVGSDTAIPGDTEVTVRSMTGFLIDADAIWYRDGLPVDPADDLCLAADNKSYTFTIVADTSFAVEAENQKYSIELSVTEPDPGANSVTVIVNGEETDVLEDLDGGSSVILTAYPAYGYLFDSWIVTANGAPQASVTDPDLYIAALGTDLEIEAVFIDNDAYEIAVTLSNPRKTAISYSLNEGPESYLSGDEDEVVGIPVFAGDKLEVFVSTDENYMVNSWWVDGIQIRDVPAAFATQWMFEDIDSDHSVCPVVVPKTYYTVTYGVGGGNGTIASATKNGKSFDSGSDYVGGNDWLVFTAVPGQGKMVEKWEVNDETVLNKDNEPLIGNRYAVNAFGNMDVLVYFTDLVTWNITEGSHENAAVTWQASPHYAGISNVDEVLDGAKVVFTIEPDEDCRLVSVEVNGELLDKGGDGVKVLSDGNWTYTVNAIHEDIEIAVFGVQLYQITATSDGNGTVIASVDKAAADDIVTLLITPSPNYRQGTLRVTYDDGNGVAQNVAVTNNAFVMPAADVTVNCSFTYSGNNNNNGGSGGNSQGGGGGGNSQGIDEPKTPLADTVTFAAFIKGFEDNTFRGDEPITREQFVAILFRLNVKQPAPAYVGSPSFNDVEADRWSFDAIEWAKGADIAGADENGDFRPADPLTRAEMAVMFVRVEKLTEMAENIFSDIDGHPAEDDILKAVEVKIFNGYPDGTFRPEGSTTRSEAVAALIRYLMGGEPADSTWQSITLTFTDVARTDWAYKYIALAVTGFSGIPRR
ncbi:MAG: S-layer homology domain-containing protein [Clostridiales bacterium]|nr:S-layer homology domain-containing protein [Clostridiales bacterium]